MTAPGMKRRDLLRRLSAIGLVAAAGDLTPGIGHNGGPALASPFKARHPKTVIGSPITVGYGNDGTGVKPGGAIDVASYAALYAALAVAVPGNVIYLAPGSYGELAFNTAYQYAAPGVTIMGQTGVSVSDIAANGAQGITLKYMDVVSLAAGTGRAVDLGNGVRMTADHLTIDPLNTNSVGVFFSDCDTTSITHCLVKNVGEGISCYASTSYGNQNVVINDNKCTNIGDNAMLLIRLQHVAVLRNYCGPMVLTDPTAHPDSIQLQTADDVEVAYNNFDFSGSTGTVDHCGGIGFSESVSNFNYHHNASFGADDNGMSFGNTCFNGTVNDNFSQGVTYTGRIIIRDGSHDVVFNRNRVSMTPAIVVYDATGATFNLTFGSGADANVTIAGASSFSDKTLYNAFLAANPLIALP